MRIEIPVHFDLWMMGAMTGEVERTNGAGAWIVRMDNRRVKRLVAIAPKDQPFCKVL